jgi:hypothetical protein
MRIRRRNIAWLTIIGTLVAIAILSGVASPLQAMVLIMLYAAALTASLLDIKPAKIIDSVQRGSLARMRMSPQAQEAAGRAARRGVPPTDLTLLDIGLIASATTSEGMNMRRTRSISKDDDGVRPYLTLHVQPSAAETTSIVRFEIVDHNGEQQYVHEMKTYLRDGEMNILADHQLPLAKNDKISGTGDGDLRVYVDGALIGALSYTLAPSLRERTRQINRAIEAEERLEDAPGRILATAAGGRGEGRGVRA